MSLSSFLADPPAGPSVDAAGAAPSPSRARTAWSVTHRLVLLVACCALLVAVIGGTVWHQMGSVSGMAAGLGRGALPAVQQALEVRLHVVQFRAAELRLLSEPNNRDAVRVALDSERSQVEAGLPRLRALPLPDDGRGALDAFARTWADYQTGHGHALALVQRSEWDEAWTRLTGDSQRQHDAMLQALADLSARTAAQAQDTVLSIEAARDTARRVTLAGGLLGGLLLMLVAAALARSITGPLRQALAVASAVAEGDLAHPVQPAGPAEIRDLLERLARMQASLRTLAAAARSGAGRIRASCDDAAAQNQDLDQRTAQQARTVQDIVQTMSAFGATVARNGAAAAEAAAVVEQATAVAGRGGAAVQCVVATMQEIDAASRRIATIVDLTADIAFQTDLLALNAAVEAARAAGQGRSFAVVAQEMRGLAHRSAAAAREIAQLIAASVEKVDAGTVQVRHAGSTMEEIVAQVSQVSGQMQRITHVGREQSAGIASVQVAVQALQSLTADNVALVQHNRAQAQALQAQSVALEETVAVFRLSA